MVPSLLAITVNKALARHPKTGKTVKAHARHLGGMYAWNGEVAVERERRVTAMKVGWRSMGKFWHSKAPWRAKRSFFLAFVVGAGTSGLESYWWGEASCATMDKVVSKYLRSMMLGRACKQGEDHRESMSNQAVRQFWQIASMQVELAVRRVRWLQDMVRAPGQHRLAIAALWGQACFEQEPTLDDEGLLTEHANPLARQIQRYLERLRHTSGSEDFFETWGRCGDSWKALFEDEETRMALLRLDAHLLRVADWLLPSSAEAAPAQENRWICKIRDHQNRVCGKGFSSMAALTAHQSHAQLE